VTIATFPSSAPLTAPKRIQGAVTIRETRRAGHYPEEPMRLVLALVALATIGLAGCTIIIEPPTTTTTDPPTTTTTTIPCGLTVTPIPNGWRLTRTGGCSGLVPPDAIQGISSSTTTNSAVANDQCGQPPSTAITGQPCIEVTSVSAPSFDIQLRNADTASPVSFPYLFTFPDQFGGATETFDCARIFLTTDQTGPSVVIGTTGAGPHGEFCSQAVPSLPVL
jgi:hypothetical protein